MSKIGDLERKTQDRILAIFHDQLKYSYLGNWETRAGNSNIDTAHLRNYLRKRKYSDELIKKALFELTKVSEDQSKSLYDINKAVYSLLRYGVKVSPGAGENNETVWLIDWEFPEKNNFGIAEEVTVKGLQYKRPDLVLYVN